MVRASNARSESDVKMRSSQENKRQDRGAATVERMRCQDSDLSREMAAKSDVKGKPQEEVETSEKAVKRKWREKEMAPETVATSDAKKVEPLWESGGHASFLCALPFPCRLPTCSKLPPRGLPGLYL